VTNAAPPTAEPITTEPPTTQGPRLAHIKGLDGLRGLAVLLVVAFHFSPTRMPGGFLGVDVFFVLSGFLITSLLVVEFAGHTRIDFVSFWMRRARRLVPALIVVVAVIGIVVWIQGDPVATGNLRGDGLASLFYVANWRFIFSGQSYFEQFIGAAPSPLRHTWSLAIEEQYYLVWPLVVAGIGLFVARIGRPARLRAAIVATCVVGAIASATLMFVLYVPGGDPSRVYYGTDTRVHLLLIGSALGALTSGTIVLARPWASRLISIGAWVAVVILAVLTLKVGSDASWLYRGGYLVFGLMIALVIVKIASDRAGVMGRIFSTPPLVGLGLISYGVYLWHWPISIWVDSKWLGASGIVLLLVRSALTLAVSLASYYIIERPIRRGALRRLPRVVRPVLVVTALVTAVAIVVVPAALVSTPTNNQPVAAGSQVVSADYATSPRCDGTTPAAAYAGHEVVLYGNSMAVEMESCLGSIIRAGGGEFTSVANNAATICDLAPVVAQQDATPRNGTRVDVLFILPTWLTKCAFEIDPAQRVQVFADYVGSFVDTWLARGDQVVLGPSVPGLKETYDPVYRHELERIAADHPGRVVIADPGRFVRTNDGEYVWSMACIDGETGCSSNGSIGVRMPLDGMHFCADGAWRGGSCAAKDAGGERRVSSALAQAITQSIDDERSR
jgi:peptidoglycan/LPS O-acetylase OafA/YrhL